MSHTTSAAAAGPETGSAKTEISLPVNPAPPVTPGSPSGPSPQFVTGFTPTAGHVGDVVTINGDSFVNLEPVFFGGSPALNVDYSQIPKTIKAPVPPLARTGAIVVGPFITAAPFVVVPTITGFSPTQGTTGNTTVTITGTGFHDTPVSVSFTGNGMNVPAAVTGGDGEYSIGVTVPEGALTGPITVQTAGKAFVKSAQPFTVLPPAPNIKNKNGFSPTSGPVGTPVQIYAAPGTKFEQIMKVSFKGPGNPKRVEAKFSVLNQKTQIDTNVPMGAVTGPIRVENITGADATTTDFTVTS